MAIYDRNWVDGTWIAVLLFTDETYCGDVW